LAQIQDPHCAEVLARVYVLQSRKGLGPNQHDMRRQRDLGSPNTIIRHLQHLVEDTFLDQEQRSDAGSNREMIYTVSALGTRTIAELTAKQTRKAIVELGPEAIAHAAWTMSEEGRPISRPTEHPLVVFHEGKLIRGNITFEPDWRIAGRVPLAEYYRTLGKPTLSAEQIAKAVVELDRKRFAPVVPLAGIFTHFTLRSSAPMLPSLPSMPIVIDRMETIARGSARALPLPFEI